MKKSEKQEYIIPESDLFLLEVEAYVCASARIKSFEEEEDDNLDLFNN